MLKSKDLIRSVARVKALQADLAASRKREEALAKCLEQARQKARIRPVKVRQGKAAKHIIRVVIPDSHGEHIDLAARDACLQDISLLNPDELIHLGDAIDCGGVFSVHQRAYTKEMVESYDADVAAGNHFLDEMDKRAPMARKVFIMGNHEDHVERWASREFDNYRDAKFVVDRVGPKAVLRLEQRGYRVISSSEQYDGLSVPGVCKLGKCHFVHGMSHSKHAAATHLSRAGANIVFGHVHRVQSVGERTLASDGFGAWCPGTLSKLQRLYQHTAPSSWQHGYAVQFVNASTGTFVHFNIPIVRGKSLLINVVDALRKAA